MNKDGMIKTLITLKAELSLRLKAEKEISNDTEAISEYERQLTQIENELNRLDKKRPNKINS